MLKTPLVEKITSYKREDVSKSTVIYSENKLRVLKIEPENKVYKTPLLMIPAMINRYYVLDLSVNNSLAKSLSEQGFTVYMIDWGQASEEDRWDTFTDVFTGKLKRVITKVTRDAGTKPSVLGYCMGGTMSLIYSSCFTDDIKNLIVLTAPIDFSKAGVMSVWTRKEYLNPKSLVDAIGNLTPEFVQNGFMSLKPAKVYRKWETAWKRQDDNKFMDNFLTLENWVNDNVPFPGGIWQEYITWLYQENRLFKDTLQIGKYKASLKNLKCNLLSIVAKEDHIVPIECAEPIHELAGSSDKTIKYFDGGHVGIISSPKLFPQLSDFIKNWLEQRD
ncbi:MAG: alpha/beta fold hydrolase [Candidatus Sericytochromatia bacterium]